MIISENRETQFVAGRLGNLYGCHVSRPLS